MKISKIILSFVLIAAMVMSLLSYFSFAEDINEPLTGKRRLYEEERSLYEKIWLNEDGTWSHKRNEYPVSNQDANGDIIYDPEFCNRNYDGDPNYSTFVRYYAVTPWNGYYNP